MKKLGKVACLLLILIITLSIGSLITKSVNAQDIPKPSVPEFTLKYKVSQYTIPATTPTYSIDPYTGEQKIQTPGSPSQSGQNRTIELKIKNQPFTSYQIDNYKHWINFWYNVSYKGSFENDWKTYFSNHGGRGFGQSESDYTVISFTYPPIKGQIDFRIQAQIGYYTQFFMPWEDYKFTGQSSGWSNVQTISIPDGEVSTTSSPNPSTSVPEFPTLTFLLLVMISLSCILFTKKHPLKNCMH
jgi:hypothetical protein